MDNGLTARSGEKTTAQVAVIGAGPIGLEIAIALKKAGIDYLHFDAKQIGYTISWFAPQTRFFSSNERIAIAGVPLLTPDQGKATREQYLTYLRTVALEFDLKVNAYESVVGIERGRIDGGGEGFTLFTQHAGQRNRYQVKKLILATGGTDKPRMLNIPGEDLPHVSHYFREPHDYFQTDLLIVGGRNSAVEAALRCHHAGARVSLSCCRAGLDEGSIKYWLTPEISGLMRSGRIAPYFHTKLVEIRPGSAILENNEGARTEVKADFVLLLTGYEADMRLCRMAGIELCGPCLTPTYDPQTMQTNVPGIYIAGTAVGGTQDKYTIFIENCHIHAERIVASLTGAAPPGPAAMPERAES
jgi:thioredoxin reductase (NADPH)